MSTHSIAIGIEQTDRAARIPCIAGPAATVFACTLLVKLIATGKEFVVAGVFGRSDELEAFLAAFLVPGVLINLTAECMSQALVPVLVRVRIQQGVRRARELLALSLTRFIALLVIVCAVAALSAPWWIRCVGWSFSPAKLRLTLHLFYALLPFVAFGGFASVCGAVLNSAQRYATPALAPAVIPVLTIISAAMFSDSLGVWALAGASVVGSAVYAAWAGGAMARAGYPLRLQWRETRGSMRVISGQHAAILVSSLVASGGLLVDQSLAATLAPGSVSALAFAGRFVSVVLALAGSVASAAIGPHFADLAARQEWAGCRAALRRWSRAAWCASLCIAVPLIIGARPVVHLCLQHGAFGSNDTIAVARVAGLSALQIPFFAVSRVHYRFLLAVQRADLIMLCGSVNLVLDIVFDVLLMRWLGVAGIVLATSLWTLSTWIFFSVCARRVLTLAESAAVARNDFHRVMQH